MAVPADIARGSPRPPAELVDGVVLVLPAAEVAFVFLPLTGQLEKLLLVGIEGGLFGLAATGGFDFGLALLLHFFLLFLLQLLLLFRLGTLFDLLPRRSFRTSRRLGLFRRSRLFLGLCLLLLL